MGLHCDICHQKQTHARKVRSLLVTARILPNTPVVIGTIDLCEECECESQLIVESEGQVLHATHFNEPPWRADAAARGGA